MANCYDKNTPKNVSLCVWVCQSGDRVSASVLEPGSSGFFRRVTAGRRPEHGYPSWANQARALAHCRLQRCGTDPLPVPLLITPTCVCSENKGDSGCLVETSQSIWGLNFIFWVSSQTYPPCNWCSGFKLEWHHDSDWWGQPCWLVDPLTGVWRGVLSSSRGTRLQRAVCRNGSNYYHLERKETSYWSL